MSARVARGLVLTAALVAAIGCRQGHSGLHAGGDPPPPPPEDMSGQSPIIDMAMAGMHPRPHPGLTYFAAIGDFGSNDTHEEDVAKLVIAHDPDFVITLGDNNYPSGERTTIDWNIGKYYSKYIGGYLGQYGIGSPINLFFPCIGNHEWYGPEMLQPYLDYFPDLPGNRRYYEFEIGRVHFYVVDSDPHEPDGTDVNSRQAAWLRDALGETTSACYKVVYFHHPPFSSGQFGVEFMRWPFAAWGADAVLAGHDHIYERLTVDGIPYFINGLGGSNRFPFRSRPDGMPDPDPRSTSRFNDDWGAQFVSADQNGMTFDFVTVGGRTIDRFTLPPKSPCR